MKKWVWFSLLVIIILAVLIRLWPISEYAIWGSDTGEYYYISNYIAEEQTIPEDYEGWGFGYPYFPGMFYLSVFVSEAAGLSLFTTLLILTPVLASLSVVVVYLITKRLGGCDRAALIAASVVAVAMPHVITTSHPMPGALGDILLLISILLFIQSSRNMGYFILLLLSTFALIITHHLATLILILSVLGIVLIRELFKHPDTDASRVKLELVYLLVILSLTLFYWFYYADIFGERVIERNLRFLNAETGSLLVFAGFGLLAGIIYLLRTKIKYRYTPPTYTARRQLVLYVIFSLGGLLVVIGSTIVTIPPMETTPDPPILISMLPLLALLSFSVLGPNESELEREGLFLIAWMFILILLCLYSMLMGSLELIIYRLLQYLIVPWAILTGFGFMAAFRLLEKRFGTESDGRTGTGISRAGIAATVFIVVLVIAAGVTAYPEKTALGNFQEGITTDEMAGVYWCRDNLEPGATLTSDHRLSSMVFGFGGINASWDYVVDVFHEDTFENAREELNMSSIPSGKKRIDYVMLSDELKEGVALYQYKEAAPMSEMAIAKFEKNPFYKIYDSNGVEIYVIDWSYA